MTDQPDLDHFASAAKQRVSAAVPDFDPAAWSVALDLVRLTDRIEADFERNVHRPLGLTWAGFRLLFRLWVVGPQGTSRLSRALHTTAPTVSSVVKTLERRGLITRTRIADDARAVSIALTPLGEELVATAFARQHEREQAWFAGLDPDDSAALRRILQQLLRS